MKTLFEDQLIILNQRQESKNIYLTFVANRQIRYKKSDTKKFKSTRWIPGLPKLSIPIEGWNDQLNQLQYVLKLILEFRKLPHEDMLKGVSVGQQSLHFLVYSQTRSHGIFFIFRFTMRKGHFPRKGWVIYLQLKDPESTYVGINVQATFY